MSHDDILIIGAGMAGASLAAQLGQAGSVSLIEMEAQPGYHATGRSVAFWTESYGGPAVQPLTSASGPLLAAPDPAFSDQPLMHPRGALHIGDRSDEGRVAAFLATFAGSGVALERVDRCYLEAALPGLKPQWTGGIAEPSTQDIDVAALHAAYLRAARQAGVKLLTETRLLSAQWTGGRWQVRTDRGERSAALIVNAAGAWADGVARSCGIAPIGITPMRRTVVQLRTDPALDATLPLILDISGRFYFKPGGGGRLWLSPHDEVPSAPVDAAAEELAVAQAIARFESVVDWKIEAVERKWAGLRSFAPDRLPVYGRDPDCRAFFWFAGQGGFGIQTAPAAALIGAALITDAAPADAVRAIDPAAYAPDRFRR